jgi:SAM-dependent methyltransferase
MPPDRAPSARRALPPALREWWSGPPRVLACETGAFLLPSLLPLRTDDRVFVAGEAASAIAELLAGRAGLTTPPATLDAAAEAGASPLPALPFDDAAFTVVVAPHCMRAWTDDELLAFLRESWRVLTHNGICVLWEVARSRSPRVNAVWRRLLGGDARLRTFAEVGHLGREAGFAWIQTLPLRPFLWPPGPRLTVLLRKEYYDERTIHLREGEIPPPAPESLP